MKKAVFLDRDGTIIRDMVYLNDPSKIEIFPESYEAITLLNRAGFLIILATNQSGVAKGIVQVENILKIHEILKTDFEKHDAIIHDAFYAPEPADSDAYNRKPNPGMLMEAARKYGIDLKKSWMVGDRMTDVEAGLRAGCQSILLQNETTPPIDLGFKPAQNIVGNVLEAAKFILRS